MIVQLSPGPGMLFVLANGITGGPRAGIAAALGAAAAMIVHTSAVAFGVAALFQAAPAALELLRFCGAAYLVWLALRAFRSPVPTPAAAAERSSGWRIFARGAVNNLLNPKIVLFYLIFLPQFADPSIGHLPAQLFVLGLALLLIGLGADVAIGAAAGKVGRLLRRRPSVGRLINRAAGTIYGVLAVRLAVGD
ncbi:LysE family translocator [Nonomuraea sp. NPDC048916]|uniref:LysE family translocator n=1 Tax=Nonomuraea sp. NPDC048916 TaxID=3154232 RepID=UPI0033C49839